MEVNREIVSRKHKNYSSLMLPASLFPMKAEFAPHIKLVSV
ncbi:hypothetical protein BACCIP111883_01030 [Sutcliffiella rhizosphaerae]|uniref:Uncharacterized protein n=1 Tax=Sutcliffiella rhizosphaerae TaxID=2880967 RepID=A0ABM8YK22_9BACI|nr:hypothetical protein BACCIP111883_01030 [Sutcliffiella rhizosphaerae]